MRLPQSVSEARKVILLGLLAALLVLAGVLAGDVVPAGWRADPQPVAVDLPQCVKEIGPTRTTSPSPDGPATRADTSDRGDPAQGVPIRVVAPAVAVDAAVVPVAVEADGVLVPPADVSRVGWWQGGAEPGSRRGTVLLTGHTYSRGDGVFDDLGGLAAGDDVQVRTTRGVVTYRVDVVEDYSKAQLAGIATRLFSESVRSQLVLVTCSDLHRGEYLGNTVVVAHPSGRSRRYID
jgi:LPXTG-site transpeptidase (sortase) family protein